ncbi:DUF2510 domain-containing protein [Yinghuangia sp. ASG 101]|uniref:DUF2510 domain-containing protein n=1 Tax=Yinghuangia sp. ASG 101 TaxID=2896848 RepID=UPI001E3BD6F2|nr:DUF2510 domain-containing protein [Yinghuangia sp. ASG 101]UGQ13896.1 DUF2510 domain-containing protein [Yinghuangia sp. ASG 101]
MTASIPPGWYDDPSAPGMERWWDGAQWTESSRPRSDSAPGVPPAPGMMADQMPGAFAGTGQTPYPPYGAYGHGPGPIGSGPGKPGNNRRNVIVGAVSLLVAAGLVAALVVLLGGGDDDKASTAGTLFDPTTGVSIPQIKGWDVPKRSGEPTHQRTGRIACEDEPSAGPSDDPSGYPSDDPSGSSSDDDCYLGEAEVITTSGSSLDGVVDALQKAVEDDDGDKLLNTETSERIKIGDTNAHVLVYKIEEEESVGGARRVYFIQAVVIDAVVDGDEYPVVMPRVYDLPNAPSRAVMATIRNGIAIGVPQPSASAS